MNKKDKTWLGVKPFFVKAALPSQTRARRVILTETRQWKRATEVNPITMDSKTGECYSTPQKSLLHPNEVYLPTEKPCLNYKQLQAKGQCNSNSVIATPNRRRGWKSEFIFCNFLWISCWCLCRFCCRQQSRTYLSFAPHYVYNCLLSLWLKWSITLHTFLYPQPVL